MPIPTPQPGETQDSFVGRFMADGEAKQEFPDRDQRLAVALQKWSERVSKAARGAMRRITKAIVTTIALCKRGKNGLKTVFKSQEDGREELTLDTIVRKAQDEEGSLLAVVYAPNRPDDDGHVADNERVIRDAAYEFLRDHRKLDIEHDGKLLPPEAAYVAESFLVGPGDERFKDWKDYEGNPADVTGGWAVRIQIEDPELRASYRNGDWDGVSMFGLVATEPVSQTKAASQRVLDRLSARSQSPQQGEIDMDEQKLIDMFKSLGDRLVETISKAAPAPAAPAKPESRANDGEGDDRERDRNRREDSAETDPVEAAIAKLEKPKVPTDINSPTQMAAFADAQRAYELQVKQLKGELSSDELAEMVKSMKASVPSDDECGIEPEDTPRERQLKRELFEMKKSRNAPEEQNRTEEDELEETRKSRSTLASRISGAYNVSMGSEGAPRSFRKVKAD